MTVCRLDFVNGPAAAADDSSKGLERALDFLRRDDYVWVTATATYPDPSPEYGGLHRWTWLRALILDPNTSGARYQLRLPAPAPGARGHLILNDTRHDVVALAKGEYSIGEQYRTATLYQRIHPGWVATLRLLDRLCGCPRSHHADRAELLMELTLDRLLDTIGELLADSPTTQEALAHTLNDPRVAKGLFVGPRPLQTLHELAAALR